MLNPWIIKLKQCSKEYQENKARVERQKKREKITKKTKKVSKKYPPKQKPYRIGVATKAAVRTMTWNK